MKLESDPEVLKGITEEREDKNEREKTHALTVVVL